MGLLGLFAVLTGFATTFIIPVSKGTFKAPAIIYVHGAFAFCWVCLFLAQAVLIKTRKFPVHRILGFAGVFIALGAAVTIIPVGMYQVERDLANGLGETAISSLVGSVTSAILFVSLAYAGILKRRRPETHKRLMLLATIVLLWPAWFRFRHYFPSVPRPDVWFGVVLADSLIIIAFIRDKLVRGSIHPVLLYTGLFIMAEHTFEVGMFDSEPWRFVANHLYKFFS